MSYKKSKSRSWFVIIPLLLIIAALGGVCVGLASGTTSDDTELNEVGRFDWNVGTIDDSGKIVDSKENLYTEDLYSVEAMEISLVDESTVTYRVVFYDENEEFISSTEPSEVEFDSANVPENAKYFRVILTPYKVDGKAVKINSLFTRQYTKQLVVKY